MFCFKKVVVSESALKTYTGMLQGLIGGRRLFEGG